MESVYQNGIWFVKNERKVHFGFSMNPQKIHELNAKESILKFNIQKSISGKRFSDIDFWNVNFEMLPWR